MYILAMTIALLLLHFTGLIQDTPNYVLLNLALNPSSIATNPLYITARAALPIAAAGAIVAGLLLGTKYELFLIAGLALLAFDIGLDLNSIYQIMATNMGAVGSFFASMIIGVFVVLFIFTVIDWWRGRD